MHHITKFLPMILALLLISCGSDERKKQDTSDASQTLSLETRADRGQQIFRDRTFGENEIACADCHADFDEALSKDERIRPGHSILGAHQRVETWNGEFSGDGLKRTAGGAAKCASLYQGKGSSVEDALTPEEADALMAFYEYISTGDEAPRLTWTAVTWPGDPDFDPEVFKAELESIEKLHGNAARGRELFDRACAPCHDTGIGPATRFLKRKAGQVSRNVRAGEESMPFFSSDKLSDQDVADVQEFVAAQ
jgi:mono/diheme cytochrome c family protein